MHTLDSKGAVGVYVHVPVGRIREHQQLGAFLVPENGRRWISRCGTVELDHTVQTDLLVLWAFDKRRRSCNKEMKNMSSNFSIFTSGIHIATFGIRNFLRTQGSKKNGSECQGSNQINIDFKTKWYSTAIE